MVAHRPRCLAGMRLAPQPGVRRRWLLGSVRHVIGIDIGSHSVKLAVVRHDAARRSIESVARCVLPPDVMHGHAVRRPETVAAAIRTLIPRGRRRATVRIAIPAPTVMMRQLTVSAAGAAQRDAEVVREVTAHIPAPLEQTVLDYQPLGPPSSDGAMRVLVVAARRELVQSYTAAARAAGVDPAAVDVDVLAVARLIRARPGLPGDVVIVHAGARYAGISRLQADMLHWIGDVPVESGAEPEVQARTVERALALFSPEAPSPPGVMLLSGGMAATPGMAQAFADRFGCPAELIDPFAALGRRSRETAARGGEGPEFAVAVGLAAHPPEDGR
jgi:Tfp pilus assembly PilM family ATPase